VIDTLIELGAVDGPTIPIAVARSVEEINRLIGDHNRYYPVERNLAIDVRSGQLLDMGEPWKPMAEITVDALRKRARAGDR